MKRLALFTFAMFGIGCAVETGPTTSPAPVDEPETTETGTLEVSPHFAQCDGFCRPLDVCLALGGDPGARCAFSGVCCDQ